MTENQKTNINWNKLAQKGERDAELRKRLSQIQKRSIQKLFDENLSENEYKNFLANIKKETSKILQDLPEKERRRRKNNLLRIIKKCKHYADLNAYGKISLSTSIFLHPGK